MAPTVSVVTPFYNTGDYLEECIQSVLAQTFEDFEYVLVDNHSTDDGREIAESYGKKDDRIRLVNPPQFLTQCANFNFALEQIAATSTYCKMVLADDWLFPRCLEEMVAVGEAGPNVGLVSSYTLIDTKVWGGGLPVDRVVFSGQEVAQAQLAGQTFPYGNESTVMYRSDILRRGAPEFFRESTMFFDTDAALRILATADFGFVHQVLSYLRIHSSSITSATKDYGPVAADTLIALRLHGARFLDETELRGRLRATENWFYEGLGRQRLRELFMPRDDEYWRYQERCLAAAGMPLQPLRMVKGAARAVAMSVAPAGHRRRLWV
jgi:glycosyltransferase involved in cell wall biosynthesis